MHCRPRVPGGNRMSRKSNVSWKVTKPWGLSFCSPVSKKTKLFPAVTVLEIRRQIRAFLGCNEDGRLLSFYLIHIQTKRDTHGFWVCHHPSPPLHSPGQYPQPGWSSLNSPVITIQRERAGVTIILQIFHSYCIETRFSSSAGPPWGLLLAAAFLWVSGSHHVPSPSPSPWKTLWRRWRKTRGDRTMERKNRENRSENLGEAIRDNAARKNVRLKIGWNGTEGEPAKGRRVKSRWQKKGALPRIKGVSLQIETGKHPVSTSSYIWTVPGGPGPAGSANCGWGSPKRNGPRGLLPEQLLQRCSCQCHLHYWPPLL